MIITPSDPNVYYDVHVLLSITSGLSVAVHNDSSDPIFLQISPTIPTSDSGSVIVESGDSYSFSPRTSNLWIRANGPVRIEPMVGNPSLPVSRVELPTDLYTSTREGFRRVRIDMGQTGFFEGREFRTFKEFSIPTGETYVVKIVVPLNAILFSQGVELDAGSLRVTNVTGGTPGGTFSETLPIIGKNNMSTRPTPFYVPQVVFTAGGTHTGGFVFDIHRVVTSQASSQQFTVGSATADERGIAVATYYVRYENIGNGTATGTFFFFWEERP